MYALYLAFSLVACAPDLSAQDLKLIESAAQIVEKDAAAWALLNDGLLPQTQILGERTRITEEAKACYEAEPNKLSVKMEYFGALDAEIAARTAQASAHKEYTEALKELVKANSNSPFNHQAEMEQASVATVQVVSDILRDSLAHDYGQTSRLVEQAMAEGVQ